MEFDILYAIQAMHSPVMDQIILFITKIMGGYGQIWLAIAVGMLLFKKTRKAGICILLSYGLVFVIGQYGLKDLIARPRPCHIDESIALLVKRPGSYSCPSTHTAWAFGAAMSIYLYHKISGVITLIIAAIIGFSRMYLFVHFPTDVLFGLVMGVVSAFISKFVTEKLSGALKAK